MGRPKKIEESFENTHTSNSRKLTAEDVYFGGKIYSAIANHRLELYKIRDAQGMYMHAYCGALGEDLPLPLSNDFLKMKFPEGGTFDIEVVNRDTNERHRLRGEDGREMLPIQIVPSTPFNTIQPQQPQQENEMHKLLMKVVSNVVEKAVTQEKPSIENPIINHIEKESDILNAKISELMNVIKEKDTKIEMKEAEKVALIREYEKKIEDLKLAYNSQIENLRNELVMKNSELQIQLQKMQNESSLKELQIQLEQLKNNATESEKPSLMSKFGEKLIDAFVKPEVAPLIIGAITSLISKQPANPININQTTADIPIENQKVIPEKTQTQPEQQINSTNINKQQDEISKKMKEVYENRRLEILTGWSLMINYQTYSDELIYKFLNEEMPFLFPYQWHKFRELDDHLFEALKSKNETKTKETQELIRKLFYEDFGPQSQLFVSESGKKFIEYLINDYLILNKEREIN